MIKENKAQQIKVQPYQRLVSLPVKSENIFHFPEGLPAFESIKDYIFLLRPDTHPFIFMHSLAPPDLAFVCIDPFLVYKEYAPKIGEADSRFLRIEKPEDLLILSIVTMRENVHECTANLQGPIVINIQSSIGKQIICDGQKYPVRHRIWNALENIGDEIKATRVKAHSAAVSAV